MLRNGEVKSASGARFTDIVNIGIGGSDPAMAARALTSYVAGHLRLHTVANVDGADLGDTLKIVSSKPRFLSSARKPSRLSRP